MSQLIRDVVAIAKTAVANIVGLSTITHEAYASVGGRGEHAFNAGVSRKALVTRVNEVKIDQLGREKAVSTKVEILENVAVSEKDRITLPDGTRPPIVSVESLLDENGNPYTVTVYF